MTVKPAWWWRQKLATSVDVPEHVEEFDLAHRVSVTSDILGAATHVPLQDDNEHDDDFEDMDQHGRDRIGDGNLHRCQKDASVSRMITSACPWSASEEKSDSIRPSKPPDQNLQLQRHP